ncbi:DUF4902 domain-containing protein [Propionivibrio dicarboxylicus]|uniref:DUF4902 domain-containing protein n=1 Tax=Propionivibrio dicarboxylicus TaxID=83767 RepID=UPI000B89729F|nr:DUF4902 domain-containing protein [Propionivibrio dicarboxylicus]
MTQSFLKNMSDDEPVSLPVLSQDGYVRLSTSEFLSMSMRHFLSGVDTDPVERVAECGARAAITGYTEWVSTSQPAVSIGWDWSLRITAGVPRYVRDGLPRSNMMLIDPVSGRDLGDEATATCIVLWIDRQAWEASVRDHIAMRYS